MTAFIGRLTRVAIVGLLVATSIAALGSAAYAETFTTHAFLLHNGVGSELVE
jgi:hypothetical protein